MLSPSAADVHGVREWVRRRWDIESRGRMVTTSLVVNMLVEDGPDGGGRKDKS